MFSASIILALVASVAAQGVTSAISPPTPAPPGCVASAPGTFEITVAKTPAKRDLVEKRDVLTLTLSGGILKDAKGRTGYIADNYQFQFDGPPQAGAIYTAGFSLCANNSLALGGKAIWYQCLSGGFYNLYDRNWAPQCSPIYIEAMGGLAATTATVSQRTDGQVIATTAVSQISDGQVIASTGVYTVPVQQISDGQIQAATTLATAIAVSQMSDGQVIAPTATEIAVSERTDGQPIVMSATSAAVATPVSEMTDGQIIAPTSAVSVVSEMTDGQIIAAATTAASNATVAVPTVSVASSAPATVTTNAAPANSAFVGSGALALVVALFASLL